MGFVQAAVYNAVVGIRGRYEPYRFHGHATRHASVQAAVAAAAHHVLVTYEPYATASLDASYAATLATIPNGSVKTNGVEFGELVANRFIQQRVGDGRNAPIFFTQPPAPGVWRPTPPAFAPMAVPWLAFVKPLMVRSGAQFGLPGPPPALTSRLYTRDLAEVETYGAVDSTARTADQTATARFYSGNNLVQFNAALREQITTRHLDIVDAARMLAAVAMTQADTVISVWRAKYTYGFWRPITAIQLADTDGNPATSPDPTWTPLIATPPYPEYVSGYAGTTGAFTSALSGALCTRRLDLTLTSTAVPGAQRHYDYGSGVNQDVINARVWLGIHFRNSDVLGVQMGTEVGKWALGHFFRRSDDNDQQR